MKCKFNFMLSYFRSVNAFKTFQLDLGMFYNSMGVSISWFFLTEGTKTVYAIKCGTLVKPQKMDLNLFKG